MTSRTDVDRLRRANAGLRLQVETALRRATRGLDLTKPEVARSALLEVVPAITERFGEVAAALSAEWFEDVAEKAGRSAAIVLADPTPTAVVQQRVKYGAGRLWSDTPAAALTFMEHASTGYVLGQGRRTVSASAGASGARWARVPSGPTTCAFCLMLASRGAVYGSRASAGDEGNHYHDDCDCTPTPIWDGQTLPYDAAALYEQYSAARREAASGDPGDILVALRKTQGIA